MPVTGMWKVCRVDHHSEHRGKALSSLSDAQQPARMRRPAVCGDEKPGANFLLARTVLSYSRFHPVPVVVQDLEDTRALTNNYPRPSLQRFHQRSPQKGMVEGHAFAILVGQKRPAPAIAGVHDGEAFYALCARAPKDAGETERREVGYARRMDQLSGKLLAGVHARVDDQNAKSDLTQCRGRGTTRGSSAYDECIKIGQATIQSLVYIPALGLGIA
jgi:hypothetical protein